MDIDTGQIQFENKLASSVFVWTQYENCYKCDLLPSASLLPGEKANRIFKTYYTLRVLFTSEKSTNKSVICPEQKLNVKDQSITKILIGKTCTVTTIEEGRNDFWPLFGAILITLLCFALFYLGRFLYNRFWRKSTDNTENNDEVSKKVSQRLKSLDAFRGITILFMIFVNWGAGEYHILDHAEWDGLHFADFIFPAFIFIMGVTMAISLRSAVVNKNIPLGSIYWTIIKRSIKLFLVGLFLGSKGNADIRYVRIPGVLQRFSLSYLFVACVHVISLHMSKHKYLSHNNYFGDLLPFWPDWILSGIMFIIYFAVTFGWKFDPDCPRGYLGPGGLSEGGKYAHCVGGAANKLDKLIFTENHIYHDFTGGELYDPTSSYGLMHDPEGLLGVTTSILLTIIGLQVGKILLLYSSTKHRLIRWSAWFLGLTIFALVLALSGAIPINKNLWSFTFVCTTGATSILVFAIFYLLIDHFKIWPSGQPLHYPGMNSILLYIGHSFTGGMMPFFYASRSKSHAWLLTQNITGVALWLIISIYLAEKKIFFTL